MKDKESKGADTVKGSTTVEPSKGPRESCERGRLRPWTS